MSEIPTALELSMTDERTISLRLLEGWRRERALASMRACLGVLSFAAFGVRHGEQCRAVNAEPYSPEAEAEYERSTRWGDHVRSQCQTWGPWGVR